MSNAREQQRLGKVLRTARERLGLSQVEVAELLGIGKNTVTRAETGICGPRHSTLMRYLETLPRLTADALMLRRPTTPPVAWPAIWRWYREKFGFAADSLSWDVQPKGEGFEVLVKTEGLRPVEGDLTDPFLRTALMQVVFLGSPAARRALEALDDDLSGQERVEEDEVSRHTLRFASDGSSLDCETRLSFDRSVAVLNVELPVKSLSLGVRAPVDSATFAPVLRAWPTSIPEGDPDIARYLYPKGVDIVENDGGARAILQRPLLGLRYRLAYEPAASVTPRPSDLGSVLRAGRKRARLTTRMVARKARVSPGSISHADSGRDPQYPTLQAYAKQLPDVLPQDVFPAVPADVDLEPREVWEYQRHLHGFEAKSVSKTTSIAEDGTSEIEIHTKGLRALHGEMTDLRVVHGITRAVSLGKNELEEILADCQDISTRTLVGEGGSVKHELRVPKKAARIGVDHTRHFRGSTFSLRRIGRFESAVLIPITYPVGKVTLRVRFPKGFEPLELTCLNTPLSVVPEPKLATLCRHRTFRTEKTEQGLVVNASVERPAIGTTLAFLWVIPQE